MKEIFLLAVGIAAGIGLKSLQINPESTRTDIGYVYTPQPENVLEKKCKSSLPHEDGGSSSQSLPRFFLDVCESRATVPVKSVAATGPMDTRRPDTR